MGSYAHYINYFGIDLPEDTAEEVIESVGDILEGAVVNYEGGCKYSYCDPDNEHPDFALELVGGYDGANTEDEYKWVLIFKKYSKLDKDLLGDINSVPTEDEINALKEFCTTHNVPWSEPKRDELSFIM